ncbi:response regulator [Salegentibacter sp. JZCK2]|uniref:ATP-binding protein n=1 Tax=Salegentibacter tibetensis TaxID=2873600 RepID=UPI001CCA45F4|nr:ATP-binding protein [Salegentibacter tibetensis]MBZ9728661.1 response regulator [Salegentibacter tibetensis]
MKNEKRKDQAVDKSLEIFTLLSHEIRTPLNAIIGISDLLQKPDLPEKEEYYNVLQTTSENLLELVNNILDFSKLKSGKLEVSHKPFNLKKKLEHSLYSQKQTAKLKGLGFKLEFDPSIPEVIKGDEVKVCQIFVNLLSNSIKFTEEGEVAIRLRLQKEDNDSLVLICKVSDTGIGIPSNQVDRVFEAFHQGEEDINVTYAGTGLGLNITQKLIKMLGGDLWVESEVDTGTCFRFTLPFGKTSATSEIQKLPQTNASILKGKKILVVEDNKVNILVVSKLLDHWQMDWEIAENGIEALEMIVSSDYDIVLMDIYMPKMNGIEAIEKIRNFPGKKYQNLPVIALTAVTEIQENQRISKTYFNDFLTKPFESEKLKELISIYCNTRQQ